MNCFDKENDFDVEEGCSFLESIRVASHFPLVYGLDSEGIDVSGDD